MAFLQSALNQPNNIKMIFRASEHGFKAESFHRMWDSIEDTLVLVRTEAGKTLGAFTHYPWDAVKGDYVNDAGRKSCILSLDLLQKLVPQGENRLIYCLNDFGPIFGNGHDLYLADQCNTNSKSCASIGYTYNLEGGKKYE